MAKVVVIHSDKASRTAIENAAAGRHEVYASDLQTGVKRIVRERPQVVVVGHDREEKEGARLLKFMRDRVMKIPVVIVFGKGGNNDKGHLVKLGAKAFLDYPVESDRLELAIQHAIKARAAADAAPPPITAEEAAGNLSMMEKSLNDRMKCFAGRNQVYIQSMLKGTHASRPRIALKCPLRAEYGLNRDVYYEWVRDTCCGDPSKCEAYRQFMEDRVM